MQEKNNKRSYANFKYSLTGDEKVSNFLKELSIFIERYDDQRLVDIGVNRWNDDERSLYLIYESK